MGDIIIDDDHIKKDVINTIISYKYNLRQSKTDDIMGLSHKIFVCDELLRLVGSSEQPPLRVIEDFGYRMKRYANIFPDIYDDCVLACNVIVDILTD